MVDRTQTRFLDSLCFVVSGPGRSVLRPALPLILVAAAFVAGCSPQSAPGPVEDSLTSGRMKIVCAPEARALIAREESAFRALYPQASIECVEGASREAVRALFAGECELAVLTRELSPEERAAATAGSLELEGYRFARDAVVVLVGPGNSVENISLEDLRRIYLGEVVNWKTLGGREGGIVPVVQPPGADLTEYFMVKVMDGLAIKARSIRSVSDSDVVARVAADPNAIGYVSLRRTEGRARPLRVAALRGLAYSEPDLEAIYRGDYPLTRGYNLYVRSHGRKLPNGFITFVTSFDGQRLVRDGGLVPTAVPVRFVRRSPMLGSH